MLPVTGSFVTPDNLKLHTVAWLPEGVPRAVVLIVHGYGEHILRYAHVAEALVNAGYAVYGPDHRGHGQSEGPRAYFARFDDAIDDLRRYFEQVREKHPGLKLFVYGHSMGTLISLAFALRYQAEISGLAISGCAVTGDEVIPGVVVALVKFVKSFAPALPLLPALPTSELSTDLTTVKAYEADPLVYRGLWKAGMGVILLEAGRMIRSRAHQLTLPLLIMHGEADKITPISGSRLIYERATSADKQLITYPGMRHEIMNERERNRPLGDLLNWLNGH